MLTYETLASDILEGNRPRPPGIREAIQRTDVWVEALEILNLAAEAAQAEEEKWGDLRRELEWGLRDD